MATENPIYTYSRDHRISYETVAAEIVKLGWNDEQIRRNCVQHGIFPNQIMREVKRIRHN